MSIYALIACPAFDHRFKLSIFRSTCCTQRPELGAFKMCFFVLVCTVACFAVEAHPADPGLFLQRRGVEKHVDYKLLWSSRGSSPLFLDKDEYVTFDDEQKCPIAMAAHHIIPKPLLIAFWNKVIAEGNIGYLFSFFLDIATILEDVITKGVPNSDDVAPWKPELADIQNFRQIISDLRKIPTHEIQQQDDAATLESYSKFRQIYEWMPGNLFLGPSESSRGDGVKSNFETVAKNLLSDLHYKHLLFCFEQMTDYVTKGKKIEISEVTGRLLVWGLQTKPHYFNPNEWTAEREDQVLSSREFNQSPQKNLYQHALQQWKERKPKKEHATQELMSEWKANGPNKDMFMKTGQFNVKYKVKDKYKGSRRLVQFAELRLEMSPKKSKDALLKTWSKSSFFPSNTCVVPLAQHHIIPNSVLRAFFNKCAERKDLDKLGGLLDKFKDRTGGALDVWIASLVSKTNEYDAGGADLSPAQEKVHNQLRNAFLWMSGNTFLGPEQMLRSDDPKELYEVNSKPLMAAGAKFDELKSAYENIVIYNGGGLVNVATDIVDILEKYHADQVIPFVAGQWEIVNKKWRILIKQRKKKKLGKHSVGHWEQLFGN